MSKFRTLGNQLYTGERSFDFVGKRKIWYAIGAVLVILAILLPVVRGGFNFGIEFRGGSEFRLSNSQGLPQSLATDAIQSVVPGVQVSTTGVGTNDLRIQTEQLADTESEAARLALADAYSVPAAEVASSFIGPNWGADVTRQALTGLIVFLLLVSILMALYFRSWKMSVAALIALAHDLVLTAGIYAGVGFEVTPAAVIGFLTILSYSLYDTVVVFDKVRENTLEIEFSETRTLSEMVNLAINQTLVRSVNTSVVAVLPIASILFIGSTFLGAGTLRDIALALFIGTIVGTYSSVFLAAPIYAHLRESESKVKLAAMKVAANRE
ncbi:protein translocase subunit SecF [Candidatus Aquiluna sp. UB-MaderosW2red]|jgi:preprotein translocase subunit SecF|uniref:protein translocase subunit SecF n=1 Tax=Candidatus Aquiluna sp. UB-MaderosW2red TaxID=1855377 RepID=UPI000875E1C6|nr:protein translocase subunit SecF [Candidatus Aquiluna sp. UB-MaderosW2red]SCX11482.1 preprotein translocase subunit SecF [Candidatus Aquiluna sp. UB-MaderosW2red]